MSIQAYIKKRSIHTAVYWGNPTKRANGSNQYDDPVEIKCFWSGESRMIVTDKDKEVFTRAVVHVNEDLSEQGMLFLGRLSDLTQEQKDDPRKVSRAYEIKRFQKLPGLSMVNEYNRIAII